MNFDLASSIFQGFVMIFDLASSIFQFNLLIHSQYNFYKKDYKIIIIYMNNLHFRSLCSERAVRFRHPWRWDQLLWAEGGCRLLW